ncbi:hypothetical protein CBR_g17970 [Chara braunii]|uniref:Myb-like domain-containing protein n=1 Tax=Chara braunii TaxID=69332 RepID=A0A388KW19_CHABU|nr:hypothetical protein CBR_g17970 [Chara braunii]|eukprot:GBG74260.1 hypothetical protein CBR_g17970 [Chara braunii]
MAEKVSHQALGSAEFNNPILASSSKVAAASMDDYDDYYEISKPRLQVVAGAVNDRPPDLDVELSNVEIAVSAAVAGALLIAAFFTSGFLQMLCVWVALSVTIGPLAPLSHVGGDCRVGVGEPVIERKPEVVEEEVPEEPLRGKAGLRKRLAASGAGARTETVVADVDGNGDAKKSTESKVSDEDSHRQSSRRPSKKGGPWTDEELEALRKGIAKFPRGTLKRWEVIAEAIGTGRSADEVVKKAKEMAERKPVDGQSFMSFVAQRKKTGLEITSEPSLRSMEDKDDSDRGGTQGEGDKEEGDEDGDGGGTRESDLWNDVQDVSLVRAMKEFPKDTAMRWERIASAVPGKTKTQCMKRFVELKKGFRGARGTGGAVGEQSKTLDLQNALI